MDLLKSEPTNNKTKSTIMSSEADTSRGHSHPIDGAPVPSEGSSGASPAVGTEEGQSNNGQSSQSQTSQTTNIFDKDKLKEAYSLRDDVAFRIMVHRLAASYFSFRYYWFELIPSALLTSVSAVLSFLNSSDGSGLDNRSISTTVGILSILATFLQTIGAYNKYSSHNEMHRVAIVSLDHFEKEIDQLFSATGEGLKLVGESQTKFLQIEQACQVVMPPALVLVVDDFRGTVEKIEDLSFTLNQNNDLDEATLRKNLQDRLDFKKKAYGIMFDVVIHSTSWPSSIDANSRVDALRRMRAIEYHDLRVGRKETAEQEKISSTIRGALKQEIESLRWTSRLQRGISLKTIALVGLLVTIAAATFSALFSTGTLGDTARETVEVAAAVIAIVILVSSMISLCLWLLQSMRDLPDDEWRDVVAPACVAYVLILGISLTLAWAARQDTDLWTKDFRYALDAFLLAAMVLFSFIFIPLVLIQLTCPNQNPPDTPETPETETRAGPSRPTTTIPPVTTETPETETVAGPSTHDPAETEAPSNSGDAV